MWAVHSSQPTRAVLKYPQGKSDSTDGLVTRYTGFYADLPISTGATTSRVLVNHELLRTVTFAMDEGQELTEHSSPRAVVVQILFVLVIVDTAGLTRERRAV